MQQRSTLAFDAIGAQRPHRNTENNRVYLGGKAMALGQTLSAGGNWSLNGSDGSSTALGLLRQSGGLGSNESRSMNVDSKCTSEQPDPFLIAYRFAINVVIQGTMSVVGIIGNMITFVVLKTDKSSTYKGSSSSTSLILLCLAVFDTLFALSCVFAQLLPTLFQMLQVSRDVGNFEARMFPFAFYFGSAARMMRNWTIVLVSIERWIAIFKPLHAQVICTVKKAKTAVLIIVLIAALYNVPRFIEATPIEFDCGNYTVLVYTRSPLRANWAYQYVYMISLYMIFVIAGPMLVLTVVNFLLMRAIRQAAAERESLLGCTHMEMHSRNVPRSGSCMSAIEQATRQGSVMASLSFSAQTLLPESRLSITVPRRQLKTKTEITRMCVGIIMLYIICELPALVYQVMFYLKVSRNITVYIQPISNCLVALNSALNFFVYVFLGKRFRKRVTDLLKCYYERDARRASEIPLKPQIATTTSRMTLNVVPSRSQSHVTFDGPSLLNSQA